MAHQFKHAIKVTKKYRLGNHWIPQVLYVRMEAEGVDIDVNNIMKYMTLQPSEKLASLFTYAIAVEVASCMPASLKAKIFRITHDTRYIQI